MRSIHWHRCEPKPRRLLVALVAAATLLGPGLSISFAGEQGMLLDLGGRVFLGNKKVPREGYPMAFHVAADYLHLTTGRSGIVIGGRYDQFLLTPPEVHTFMLRGTLGWAGIRNGLNLTEGFVGFRHTNDVLTPTGRYGSAGGPMVGYRQRYGVDDLHVFWEAAAVGYVYTAGGGRVGVETRLRLAYGVGTIEWYLRFDPGTGFELGMGFGGAGAFGM